MGSDSKTQSLLPWLAPTRSTISLRIDLSSQPEKSIESSSTFPFALVNQPNSYEKIISAGFFTANGRPIKRVFLQIQNDNLIQPSSSFKQITNADIESLWQNRFAWNYGNAKPETFIVLSNNSNTTKKTLPFKPLFYCCRKKVFFHPPCPECGKLLDLCAKDDLLTSVGLLPYLSSIKRYLYCPSCSKKKTISNFYIKELDGTDPEELNDCFKLIEKFSDLIENNPSSKKLPCSTCQNLSECFGPQNLAHSEIIPLSFYPFHMFIFDAPHISSLDFLAFISGASIEEIENTTDPGTDKSSGISTFQEPISNLHTPFFDKQKRPFGEILLLKLTFLHQLSELIFHQINNQPLPGDSIALEQFWVNITDQEGLLSPYSNYVIKRLGIGFEHDKKLPQLFAPFANDLHSTAYLWFQSLLTNKKQSKDHIYDGLANIINNKTLEDFDEFRDAIIQGSSKQFLPKNIFWNPSDKIIDSSWNDYWFASLKFGWSLLRASLKNESEWKQAVFQDDLKNLINNIKKSLNEYIPLRDTEPGSMDTASSKSIFDNDNAILNILTSIQKAWQARNVKDIEEFEATQILQDYHEINPEQKPTSTNQTDFDPLATQILQPGNEQNGLDFSKISSKESKNFLETQEIPPKQSNSIPSLSKTKESGKSARQETKKTSKQNSKTPKNDESIENDKFNDETETVMMSREELEKLMGKS